jgi:hypothetical protein
MKGTSAFIKNVFTNKIFIEKLLITVRLCSTTTLDKI